MLARLLLLVIEKRQWAAGVRLERLVLALRAPRIISIEKAKEGIMPFDSLAPNLAVGMRVTRVALQGFS